MDASHDIDFHTPLASRISPASRCVPGGHARQLRAHGSTRARA